MSYIDDRTIKEAEFIVKTKFEYFISDSIRDIKIIEFAILSSDVTYKTNIYNKMKEKYNFDLERIGYTKALDLMTSSYTSSNLSEESIIRNSLSILRKWIIRCSGYMCVKKIAEENVVDGIDMYMKKYAITDDIVDINTLNERLNDIDEDILSCLRNSI